MKRARRRTAQRAVRLFCMFAAVAVLVVTQVPAAAQLNPELPLPVPTSTPLLDSLLDSVGDPVNSTLDTVSGLLGATTEEVGLGGRKSPPPSRAPVAGPPPKAEAWSLDRPPAAPAAVGSATWRAGDTTEPPVSYGAAVADGFARAASRAASLAASVAAPMILAMFAVGLLYVAARGPGRLVKVEEDRKTFREQRTFRL